jgi:hypothetical protein
MAGPAVEKRVARGKKERRRWAAAGKEGERKRV